MVAQGLFGMQIGDEVRPETALQQDFGTGLLFNQFERPDTSLAILINLALLKFL